MRATFKQGLRRAAPESVVSVLRRWCVAGGGKEQWLRISMYEDLERELRALGPEELDVVEISGSQWSHLPWRSHQELDYPEWDLCDPPADVPTFDVVVCDQVLEHVLNPAAAVATLRRLVKPGGHVLVATPFLVKLHFYPGDYWRFTPDGLKVLLRNGGLEPLWVRSWGNRWAVMGNFDHWKRHRRWHPMRNEETLPMVVWTLAAPSTAGIEGGVWP